MTVFVESPLHLGSLDEEIKWLQQAVDEETRRVEEVKRERARVKEDAARCTKELEWRMMMVVEADEVADVLQELGRLLQEEKDLSDQLNVQVPVVRHQSMRNHSIDLHEMEECVTEKERSLAAQISEAEQALAEARARCPAGKVKPQALFHIPASKPRQKQRK